MGIKTECLSDIERLSQNWGRVKGGNALIKKKVKDGTLGETIDRLKKASSARMKIWHQDMKKNCPEEYYRLQYERFKKVGKGYQIRLDNGISVRSELEAMVGNFLAEYFPSFQYESYLNVGGKVYFPDFAYKNVIIEVTEWKHPSKEKIQRLMEKAKAYNLASYMVCFFIPLRYRKFYKELRSPIFSALPDLKHFINASVA